MTNARAVLTAVLIVLAIANLVLGHWGIGFSLVAVVIANGTLAARDRRSPR